LEEVERAVEAFIDQIRNSEIDNIVLWINTLACLSDCELPYGPPPNLNLPQIPQNHTDPNLSSFIEHGLDTFLLLDAEYHGKLEEISLKLKNNFEALQSSQWSARDSALLQHLSSSPLCEPLPLQSQLLRRLFPSHTQEEIIAQKYRLKMKRAWEEKRDNIVKDWTRDKEELRCKTNAAWSDLQTSKEKRLTLEIERKKQKERCKHWATLLDSMRKAKGLKVRRIAIMVEPFERAMEEREKARLELEAKKRLEQKRLVQDFKEKRKIRELQRLAEQQQLEHELERNKTLQAKYNHTRVLVRQFEHEKKQEHQRKLEKLKEQEKFLNAQLLEKTKHKVELDYDPSNLYAETYATKMRNHELQTWLQNPDEEEMIKFFRERYSFSTEEVCKDRRVRLEAKLRDAGLMNTTYARQVLAAMQPKPKPHLQSQIKLGSNED
jgi:hypothetical protein